MSRTSCVFCAWHEVSKSTSSRCHLPSHPFCLLTRLVRMFENFVRSHLFLFLFWLYIFGSFFFSLCSRVRTARSTWVWSTCPVYPVRDFAWWHVYRVWGLLWLLVIMGTPESWDCSKFSYFPSSYFCGLKNEFLTPALESHSHSLVPCIWNFLVIFQSLYKAACVCKSFLKSAFGSSHGVFGGFSALSILELLYLYLIALQ